METSVSNHRDSPTPVILVTGKDGQLGFELTRSLQSVGFVVAVGRAGLDLNSPDAISALVDRVRPNFIVNAAAYTAVDKAESDVDQCFAVNAAAPGALAQAAKRCGATLLHFSTDYVFDGKQARPYRETDAPNPQSVYGLSKLAGERAIAEALNEHFIFRTSWVVGAFGENFARTMVRLARERDELRVVADQWGVPTPAYLLADVTAAMIRSVTTDASFLRSHAGTYHLAPLGETTWHGYAQHVLRRMGELGIELKTHADAIQPITTEQFPTPAKRPANSRIDTSKLRSVPGIVLPQWQESLEPVVRLLALQTAGR
jgi:dTDP-4-dehydrorhamnose reductase